ncbi:MAG: hypothetical protein KJ566_01555 [Nanoarchaeota archaeon]|nr:hypothetical protein [Nanoarchaeota archaeon]
MNKKLIGGIILVVIVLGLGSYFVFRERKCGDGVLYGECSENVPFYCEQGMIVSKASVCGCQDSFVVEEELCNSKYQINPKTIFLKYFLNGKENEIEFVVYQGVVDYISNVSNSITYYGETPSRLDFKLKNIEEPVQREFLLSLVVEIQNLDLSKENQARVAISLVQNIPYNETEDKAVGIRGDLGVNRSRYPYEVLYDMQGVCEGKSELLSFLLKELGYGVGIFYYFEEDHEAVGIKCPLEYSLDETGYCFVETTGPAIISDDQGYYLNWGKLSSDSEFYLIQEGVSLGKVRDYKDADNLAEILISIENTGMVTRLQKIQLDNLKERYGLEL